MFSSNVSQAPASVHMRNASSRVIRCSGPSTRPSVIFRVIVIHMAKKGWYALMAFRGHSGSGFQGRPSMGSWLTYGLGSVSENLPGFVVLESGLIPPGGMDLFGSGFLPATYQGTLFRKGEYPVSDIKT